MQLAASVGESIVAHAREAAPNEACGLLGGRADTPSIVLDSIRTPNVATTPTHRFEIDPEALLAGRETLIEKDQELLGFYHSHPEGPTEPSATDLETARWTDKCTVIVSLRGSEPELGAWLFTGEAFEPKPITVTTEGTDGDST